MRTIAYIYCVGSRQPGANEYCSRYCCAAAVHASLEVAALDTQVHQYHLYRDIRTYGKYELLYTQSRKLGSVYLKFPEDTPPAVSRNEAGQLTVTTRDTLTGGEELTIPADLVVLVTGMVPRKNEELLNLLKLPVGTDGFFNEIHPKLRPVETVVDGVLIAGSCQGPKNSAESVASGLAAATQSASILKKGFAELDPLVATVNADACVWCGKCVDACPYAAVEKVITGGRERGRHQRVRLQGLWRMRARLSRGCDRPAGLHRCPDPGRDRQHAGGAGRMSTTTIRDIREIVREEPLMHPAILEALKAGPLTIPEIAAGHRPSGGRGGLLGDGHAALRTRSRRCPARPTRATSGTRRWSRRREHDRAGGCRPARRRAEVRGGGRLGVLQLRQLHGDLPALRRTTPRSRASSSATRRWA